MKILYIIIVMVLWGGIVLPQEKEVKDSLLIDQKELPSSEILRRDIYSPATLWGYIDGGADIYFEYGFEKAVVEDIRINGVTFKCEIYQMKDPASAFGVFSISKSKCRERDTSNEFSCITNYQVQYARDKYYVSIINEKGTEEAKNKAKELGRIIASKLPSGRLQLPELFYHNKLFSYKENLKLIKGILGIQNTLPELEDQFSNFSDYLIYYLPIETSSGFLNLYYLVFNSRDDLKKFAAPEIEKSKNSNPEKRFQILSDRILLFTESNLSDDIYKSYVNGIIKVDK